jgi:hypothetical protein
MRGWQAERVGGSGPSGVRPLGRARASAEAGKRLGLGGVSALRASVRNAYERIKAGRTWVRRSEGGWRRSPLNPPLGDFREKRARPLPELREYTRESRRKGPQPSRHPVVFVERARGKTRAQQISTGTVGRGRGLPLDGERSVVKQHTLHHRVKHLS